MERQVIDALGVCVCGGGCVGVCGCVWVCVCECESGRE